MVVFVEGKAMVDGVCSVVRDKQRGFQDKPEYLVDYEQQPQATPQTSVVLPLLPSHPAQETELQEEVVEYEAPPPPPPPTTPKPPNHRRKT